MFSRSGNTFAWHFQSLIFLLQVCIRLLSFSIWVQRGEDILKGFPTGYKTTSFLLSSDVYLGWAEHPSLWLFDSCESQDDLIPSREWQSLISIVIDYFSGCGQMFVTSAPILCSVSNWCVLCMSANKEDVQKQTRAWTGTTLLCLLCSRSVEMKPKSLHIPYAVMHTAIYYILKFETLACSLQYHP